MLRAGAVVVALLTASVVASDLAELHRHARDLGVERDAVVAARDLTIGVAISDADLRVRRVHASQLPPGVPSARTDVVGRVVTVPVLGGDFVSTGHLAPRRRAGVDGAIPRGMRAMRVVVTDAIRPRTGAIVDVLATFEAGSSFAGGGELDLQDPSTLDDGSSAAVVVADGVLVLGSDRAATAEGGIALGITLLVTPRQARELAFATTHGVLAVALAPPEHART